MARRGKIGIDYFSHDVDILQDKKIKIIKAKYGLLGYAVYLRLLEELYRENGYYLHIDEDFNILFSDDSNIDLNEYILILNECINKGLFDKAMYKQYGILTSVRIQTNYCLATERRKEVEFTKEYLLVDVAEKYNAKKVNVYIKSLNVDINPENADIGTQSKVKESKVKDSKEQQEEKELLLVDEDEIDFDSSHKDKEFGLVVKFFEDNIRGITPMEGQVLAEWKDKLGHDLVIYALEQAVANNARNIKYIEAILRNLETGGAKSRADAEEQNRKHKETKVKPIQEKLKLLKGNHNNRFQNFDGELSGKSNEEIEQRMKAQQRKRQEG